MTEKTFDELINEKLTLHKPSLSRDEVLKLLQQVREATSEEFCQALLGVTLPAENARKIGRIVTTTDRITITDND